MAQFFSIHPESPQPRLIREAASILQKGGIAAVPTEGCYLLACHVGDKEALMRMRRIRQLDEKHLFTLLCRDLSDLATYAKVDNAQYRLLKNTTPGAYTFILAATKEVPRRLQHPKRNTIGLRIPNHPVLLALLDVLGEPLMATTLHLPQDDQPLYEPWEIRERLEHSVDVVIDGGYGSPEMTTVIDLSDGQPFLIREGAGALAPLGL